MFKYAEEQLAETKDSFFVKKVENLIIGGQPVIKLQAPFEESQRKPSIVGATILPGRGMHVLQLEAYLPGFGLFDMLSSVSPEEAVDFFNGYSDDNSGNRSFKIGGALLLPFAGRMRGVLLSDRKTLNVSILNKSVQLMANWSSGGNSHGEKIAHHGLILKKSMDIIKTGSNSAESFVEARLNAEDFGCGWPGRAVHTFKYALTESGFNLSVTTKNIDKEKLPVSTGWHPYFTFPGKKRRNVGLMLKAASRIEVNNYDDVFPTGNIQSTEHTVYDFSRRGGRLLGSLYLDDCFTDLHRDNNGDTNVEIFDPVCNYGLKVSANNVINAVQVYAPLDKPYIALEPQMNLPDPFNTSVWGERETGMTVLGENEEVTFTAAVSLFNE